MIWRPLNTQTDKKEKQEPKQNKKQWQLKVGKHTVVLLSCHHITADTTMTSIKTSSWILATQVLHPPLDTTPESDDSTLKVIGQTTLMQSAPTWIHSLHSVVDTKMRCTEPRLSWDQHEYDSTSLQEDAHFCYTLVSVKELFILVNSGITISFWRDICKSCSCECKKTVTTDSTDMEIMNPFRTCP